MFEVYLEAETGTEREKERKIKKELRCSYVFLFLLVEYRSRPKTGREQE